MPKQVQDKNGNFVPKTKTNIVRHQLRTKKYLIPIMLVVIAVGGYVVSRSFASTTTIYSYTTCAPRYDDTCLRDSVEANVATLYQAILGRPADPSGLNYYTKKVTSRSLNYGQVASNLLASSRGKELYPASDSITFVKTVHKNLFNRQPTGAEQNQWVGYMSAKKLNHGQVIARLALDAEYKARQESTNLALLKQQFKIVQPTGPYTTVASFDLAGTDAKLCPGKVEPATAIGGNACVIPSKETRQGVYEQVVSVPLGTLEPGEYDLVYTANFEGSFMYDMVTITKNDGVTSVLTSHIAGSSSMYGAGGRLFGTTDKNARTASLAFNRHRNEPNTKIIIFAKDIDRVNITKMELRKRIDPANYAFLMLKDVTYSGFNAPRVSAGPELVSDSSRLGNNPKLTQAIGESVGYCEFKYAAKKCTLKVKHSVPAGKYVVAPYVYRFGGVSSDGADLGLAPLSVDMKVTRIDNNKLVSERQVVLPDLEVDGLKKKYPLPFDLRKWSNTLWASYKPSVTYTVDTPATVEIEMSFEQPQAPGPAKNEDYNNALIRGRTSVAVWYMTNTATR